MFPPPDFESGASTNSATGARGVDNSRGAGRVNAEMPLSQVDSFTASRYAVGRGANAGSAGTESVRSDILRCDKAFG